MSNASTGPARSGTLFLLSLMCAAGSAAASIESRLMIPQVAATQKRAITIEDISALRHVDSLSVSPDGSRFAIFLHQADPSTNTFRSGWFCGSTVDGGLQFLADGGEIGPGISFNGQNNGQIEGHRSRWSPDGQWIAYTRKQDSEVQIWLSRADGKIQRQLSHNAADPREFAWNENGSVVYFTVGQTRAEVLAWRERRERQGYQYDDDINTFTDFMQPRINPSPGDDTGVWAVRVADGSEYRAGEADRREFERARANQLSANGSSSQNVIAKVLRKTDADVKWCSPAKAGRLICAWETQTQPAQIVAIDLKTGRVRLLADVNPEFKNIRLGNVERFEWATPVFDWNRPGQPLDDLYEKRDSGYILFPPDFDPAHRYPVFISPYVASWFDHPSRDEHPLHVYAANGFVVLNLSFPAITAEAQRRLGSRLAKQLYSSELGFPHLTMFMESTLRGLDTVAARGFIDERRVGIGGVSHGSFVSLYMLQKYDRIAAISISSPNWGPFQYYVSTRKFRDARQKSYGAAGYETFLEKPEGKGLRFWNDIDIAEHVDAIEAPVLMNLADREVFAMLRLIRNMEEAGKPYDAYVFSHESHLKWQPAHLSAIRHRNLDWFRFWLQGYEDHDPSKAQQYARWRNLRASRIVQ